MARPLQSKTVEAIIRLGEPGELIQNMLITIELRREQVAYASLDAMHAGNDIVATNYTEVEHNLTTLYNNLQLLVQTFVEDRSS
jgi:hypothetical protein